jgi:hypothetical protein
VREGCSHELKAWPHFFRSVWDGTKTFELRRDDRGYQVGDILLLREYDPDRDDLPCGERYTGRELTARVEYILVGGQLGLEEGYVIMSIKRMQRSSASSRFPAEVA